MKRTRLLNSELSYEIGRIGHTASITLCDAGLPIPKGVKRIDLAIESGYPSFIRTLDAILSEMMVEEIVISSEIDAKNPGVLQEQQIVEVAKALNCRARVMFMDEPTSAISDQEIEVLFRLIASLKRDGMAIVYVSHKLDELFSITDRITVLRDGRLVKTLPTRETNHDEIVRLMVGRQLSEMYVYTETKPQGTRLRVSDLSQKSATSHFLRVDDVSFSVEAGEVLGVFGLMGAGRTELLESIFGLRPRQTTGAVFVDGQECMIRSPSDAMQYGIGLVPEDRKQDGLVLEMSVEQNISLASLQQMERGLFLSSRAERTFREHFCIAAGLSKGEYHGAAWNDGDFYKFIEAVCTVQAVERDPEWDRRLDEIITVIGKAQRPDGYIHTPVLVAARNGDADAKPFGDRFNFEMYNMGHLMTAACLHHQINGKSEFLAIACKAADFLDAAFRDPTPEQARHAVCPSHYMGIVDLYRSTGEPRYLALAKRLVQMRDLVDDGGDDNQDRVPFAQQTEAVGHAVRATYLYAGIADLYAETGDVELWPPLETIWKNVVENKLCLTGGCGALYDGASPDGAKNQSAIRRAHQAFGRNYQLPNVTAHNETCANIGNVLWNWRMFLASGEAKYIDVMELGLYNSVLSGVGLDGTDFFYTNPLRQLDSAPVQLRWSRARVPFMTCFCCPPNVVRTVAEASGYAYGVSDGTLWVNLYGSNTLDTTVGEGNRIRLEQKTNYPWDGQIRITVLECGSDPVRLKLRIPGWAESATLSVDGTPADVPAAPGTYATIERVWQPGATIDLQIPLPPQLVESHPLVEETRNHVAIKRGPVVYCLESIDLPQGVALTDVRIPSDMTLEPRFDAGLLQGVTVLEGTLVSRPAGNWSDSLYREFQPVDAVPHRAAFIPYCTWANRGQSEMTLDY